MCQQVWGQAWLTSTLLTVPVRQVTLCFCLLGGFSDSDLVDGASNGGRVMGSLSSLSHTCCTQGCQGLQSDPQWNHSQLLGNLFSPPPFVDASRMRTVQTCPTRVGPQLPCWWFRELPAIYMGLPAPFSDISWTPQSPVFAWWLLGVINGMCPVISWTLKWKQILHLSL